MAGRAAETATTTARGVTASAAVTAAVEEIGTTKTEKLRRVAIQVATRVGVEAGAVMMADTHDVTEEEMATTTAVAMVAAGIALAPVLPTAITAPETTTAAIATAITEAAGMTTETVADVLPSAMALPS